MIATGAPATVMAASPLFAPQVARLFPEGGWMTTDDVRGPCNMDRLTKADSPAERVLGCDLCPYAGFRPNEQE
ncbi:MAG: hypothetical protein R3A10_11680 [Caldilineaceae bacterium]